MTKLDQYVKDNNIDPALIDKQRQEAEKYALRNRTQMLIMKEIAWYHSLVFSKGQVRFWNDWFRLKLYLFKKYKIKF